MFTGKNHCIETIHQEHQEIENIVALCFVFEGFGNLSASFI